MPHEPATSMSHNFVGRHQAWQAIDTALISTAVGCIIPSASIVTLGYCAVNAIMQKSFLTCYTPLFIAATVVGGLAPVLCDMPMKRAEKLTRDAFSGNTYDQQIQPALRTSTKLISRISLLAGAFMALCAIGVSSSIPYAKEIFGAAAIGMCFYGAGRGQSIALDVQGKMQPQLSQIPAGPT